MNRINPRTRLKQLASIYDLPVKVETFYTVDIVCDSRGTRECGEQALTIEEAEKLAAWFDNMPLLRAEVVGPLERVTVTTEGRKAGGA